MKQQPPKAEAETPVPEDEGVHSGKMALLALAALVLFGGSVFVAYKAMEAWHGDAPPFGHEPLPQAVGQAEINIVNQKDFAQVDYAQGEGQAQARKTLSTYGWVDRDKGLIHVPVERAIDALLTQPGGPQK